MLLFSIILFGIGIIAMAFEMGIVSLICLGVGVLIFLPTFYLRMRDWFRIDSESEEWEYDGREDD